MNEIAKSVRERIVAKLTERFRPVELEVLDESDAHRGHGGWREGGGTHFRVRIVAAAFAGTTRLQRHRMVNETLAEELAGRVHALAVEAAPPPA